jgi:hypothetical protein
MQNWGVSTVLIESGGWQDNRYQFLQKMNFIALLSCFNAIADGSYKQADASAYDSLAENGKNLYELVIQDVTVIDGTGIPPYRADIAINYEKKTGTIVDVGDLDIFAAKDTINGSGLTLTPGFVGVVHNVSLNEKVFINKAKDMIKDGFTTILLTMEKDYSKKPRKLKQSIAENNIPANLGGILYLNRKLHSSADTLQVLRYLEKNMIGIAGDKQALTAYDSAKFLNKPVIPLADVNRTITLRSLDPQTIKTLSSDQTDRWKIPRRGKIRTGQIADFVLFSTDADSLPVIDAVFVKGHRVWQQGEWKETSATGERWLPF